MEERCHRHTSTCSPSLIYIQVSEFTVPNSVNTTPHFFVMVLCRKFENVYIGWGIKHSSVTFNPALPPAVMEEFPAGGWDRLVVSCSIQGTMIKVKVCVVTSRQLVQEGERLWWLSATKLLGLSSKWCPSWFTNPFPQEQISMRPLIPQWNKSQLLRWPRRRHKLQLKRRKNRKNLTRTSTLTNNCHHLLTTCTILSTSYFTHITRIKIYSDLMFNFFSLYFFGCYEQTVLFPVNLIRVPRKHWLDFKLGYISQCTGSYMQREIARAITTSVTVRCTKQWTSIQNTDNNNKQSPTFQTDEQIKLMKTSQQTAKEITVFTRSRKIVHMSEPDECVVGDCPFNQ